MIPLVYLRVVDLRRFLYYKST